jgi:hypothetical protein
LPLVKIRYPDETRLERGDADFTLSDYQSFKSKSLWEPWYKLIQRENFEMIEYQKEGSNVLVYFSFPPLDQQLWLTL